MQPHLYTTEHQWRALFHGALDGIAIVDNQGNFVEVNHAACTIFGCGREQILGRHIADFSLSKNNIAQIWDMFVTRGSWSGECTLRRPDGTQRIVQFNSTAHFLPGLHMAIMRDVTEQKKSEEALRELSAILESTEDAIYSWNREGRIVSWNRGAEKVYGYSKDEAIGKSVLFLVPRALHDEGLELLGRLRQGECVQQLETVRLHKDGRNVHVSLTISPIKTRSGEVNGGSVISRDISQRRLLEEQLRQAQKMEAIGHLAGGVAHDFNNLLTVINGYCEILLRGNSPTTGSHSFLLEIREAGERAASLTRQLLAFSRKQVVSPIVLDLNHVVGEMDRMLRRLIGANIELSTQLDPGLGHVKADPSQMEQVIMNLVVNARDAMPDGGQLTIETDMIWLDANYCQAKPGVLPGRYVRLTVSDTGRGMDESTQSRIFEPFFTTKEVGKGTGLGLATVYGIVRQSEGHVTVYSEIGRGTTFRVYLPNLEASGPLTNEVPAEPSIRGGLETILIAEDDEAVRHLLSISLEAYGYHVLQACDGAEAMAALGSHPRGVDLVISDVVMPRMDGSQLAQEMSALFPQVKLLMISGYPGGSLLQESTPFLQKPFTFSTLAQKVREVLDRAV